MKRSFVDGSSTSAFKLTKKQEIALNLMKEGHNVFITGPGGTGKSFIINIFKDWCDSVYQNIAITSTTGVSALMISGRTLHSWAGIGLGNGSVTVLTNKIIRNYWAKKRWMETSVLVIDEISMLDPALFDKLDKIGRFIRKDNSQPFGGLQIIVTGN